MPNTGIPSTAPPPLPNLCVNSTQAHMVLKRGGEGQAPPTIRHENGDHNNQNEHCHRVSLRFDDKSWLKASSRNNCLMTFVSIRRNDDDRNVRQSLAGRVAEAVALRETTHTTSRPNNVFVTPPRCTRMCVRAAKLNSTGTSSATTKLFDCSSSSIIHECYCKGWCISLGEFIASRAYLTIHPPRRLEALWLLHIRHRSHRKALWVVQRVVPKKKNIPRGSENCGFQFFLDQSAWE